MEYFLKILGIWDTANYFWDIEFSSKCSGLKWKSSLTGGGVSIWSAMSDASFLYSLSFNMKI